MGRKKGRAGGEGRREHGRRGRGEVGGGRVGGGVSLVVCVGENKGAEEEQRREESGLVREVGEEGCGSVPRRRAQGCRGGKAGRYVAVRCVQTCGTS